MIHIIEIDIPKYVATYYKQILFIKYFNSPILELWVEIIGTDEKLLLEVSSFDVMGLLGDVG